MVIRLGMVGLKTAECMCFLELSWGGRGEKSCLDGVIWCLCGVFLDD